MLVHYVILFDSSLRLHLKKKTNRQACRSNISFLFQAIGKGSRDD